MNLPLRILAAAAVLPMLALACGPGGAPGREAASPPAPSAVPFEEVFRPLEVIRLATAPDDPFGAPVAVVPWSGRLAVVDQLQSNVKVFDAAGRLVATLGRAGEGPGEFRSPMGAAMAADGTLAVFDLALDRVTFFGPGGEYLRAWRTAASDEAAFAAYAGGAQLLLGARLSPQAGPAGEVDGRSLHLFGADGARVRSFAPQPRSEALYEDVLNNVVAGAVGGVVVSAERTGNLFTTHDLRTGATRAFRLVPADYRPYVWPRKPFRPEAEELEQLRLWANRHTWVGRIVPLGGPHFAAAFSTTDEASGTVLHQYVLAGSDGAQLRATAPTPVYLQFADSTRVFGTRVDEEGNLDLHVFRRPVL